VADRAGGDGLADDLSGVDDRLSGVDSRGGGGRSSDGRADVGSRGGGRDSRGGSRSRGSDAGARGDSSDQSTVVGDISSADTDEVRSSLRGLAAVRAPSTNALHDVRDESLVLAVAAGVGVVGALGGVHPGVQALGDHAGAVGSRAGG